MLRKSFFLKTKIPWGGNKVLKTKSAAERATKKQGLVNIGSQNFAAHIFLRIC